MDPKTVVWQAGCLTFALPKEFELADHGPLQPTWEAWSWKNSGDQSLHLDFWYPRPSHTGGPMQAVSEWTEQIGGKDVKVMETSLFEGRPQKVLVTFFNLLSPAISARLSAYGMSRQEFSALLGAIEFTGNETGFLRT
jgi:hypothetical protein